MLIGHVEATTIVRVTEQWELVGHHHKVVANKGENLVISKVRALMLKDVNSIRPRYTNGCGQSSRDDEAITGDEEMSKCSRQTSRGDRRERVPKEWSRYLGDPKQHGPSQKPTGETITLLTAARESERP